MAVRGDVLPVRSLQYSGNAPNRGTLPMTSHEDAHAALVRRFLTDVVGEGDVDARTVLVADDVQIHGTGLRNTCDGNELVGYLSGILAACDFDVSVEKTVASGDFVGVRSELSGTLDGLPEEGYPQRRSFTVDCASFHRIEGDRIVEMWILVDHRSLIEQLGGTVPATAVKPANDNSVHEPEDSNNDR